MNTKKLILDYSKWICGGDGIRKMGLGSVGLLNKEGYMCCLGQWSLQLGATPEQIINKGEPFEVPVYMEGLNYHYDEDEQQHFKNDGITNEAISINDDEDTTPEEKVTLLTELCAKYGFQLEVINAPDPST